MLPDFLLPYSAVDTRSPIFQQMWLHLRLINTEARLRRFNQITLIGIPLIAVLWWLIERLNLDFGYVQPDFSYRFINFVLFIALSIMLLSSLYSISTVLGMFHTQFNSGYWEALRLTPQYDSTILMSHDAIAQLRLWPFTAAEIGLRIAVVTLFILNTFYFQYHASADQSGFVSSTLFSVLFWIAWGVILLVSLAFILEPILRSRLIIALHLIVAIRIRYTPLTAFTGFLVLILVHGIQAILVACLWLMSEDFSRQEMGGVVIIMCLLPLTLLASIIFGAIYTWLRKTAISSAYNSAFRQD